MSAPFDKVLAIRLDTIGDVLMTTPALKAMADRGSRVTLLTSSVSRSLAPLLPYLDDVVTLVVPWMKPAGKHRPDLAEHLATLDYLRAAGFDLSVVFTVCTQDPACALYLSHLCGIGRVAAHTRGKLYGLATDPVPDTDAFPPERHEVVRQLQLVEALGYPAEDDRLAIEVPPPTRRVRSLLEQVGDRPWCLVHPGATAPSRLYPTEQWAEVIDRLQNAGVRVALSGGRHDRARTRDIAQRCAAEPIRADGRLTLPELAALMQAAPVAATCNSAAAHLAAATGTPVVTLYAGTNPQHAPWTGRATVLRRHTECTWCLSSTCRHATPHCISTIAPEEIAAAVLSRMADRGGRRHHSSGEPLIKQARTLRPS